MSNSISRRHLLKAGALLAGGLPFAGSLLDQAQASPVKTSRVDNYLPQGTLLTEKDIALNAPAELKARLFANENPFGPSDKAKKAIMEALPHSYQYPFMFLKDLSGKIAEHEGIKEENILMASGSSPLLMAAAICFSKPGGNIITGDPSYEDLPSKAARFSEKWIKVPLTSEYKLDLDAMEKAIDGNTGLVYICNPNNPTATILDTDKLKAFCERVSKRVTVFVDEAYIDYLDDPAGTTLISGIKAGQNLIVARTFSKLYGFAGLRVGYVVAQPDMIKKLSEYTEGPMSISATSLQAAIASYQDKEFLQGALKKTVASRDYLYEVLKKEGYTYIPSNANFVLFPIKMDGVQFADEMMKRGVGVRHWKVNSKDYCRVSIGRMDEMEAFAAAFKELS
ncbi:MAG TPA: aminotransferase class I/II-fold pyridoxal phosphate-dependent enzyme [Puia sp.]|jgi:histidinol-phosphate aminotransferase|nr:aminotransferase class I/II-fold pyridoxal phosphate-dependent enzyme [Puia sp.]